MGKRSKHCLVVFLLALIFPAFLHAQQAVTDASAAKTNATVANPVPAGQAPIDVVKKLSDLVHAGKYVEAQQLIPGLLVAYPDDQRLIKAKALLDKLLATAKPTNVAPSNIQSVNPVVPAPSKPEATAGEFVGIGLQLRVDPESHKILIAGVFPNSPASMAGLSPGLIVDKVDGVSTSGKSYEEAVRPIGGPIGTQVSLGLIDSERGTQTNVVMTRQMIHPATDSDPAQLTGMDKVDYDALIELARQAQQTTDLSQQKKLLLQFMSQSSLFLQRHPGQMLLWKIVIAAAISLNDPMTGYVAGQRLLAAGAADSNDSNLLALLAQLKNKGWLDKQSAEKHAKYDWLVGTWSESWSESWAARGVWPANLPAINQSGNFPNVEISVTGSNIDIYDLDENGNKQFSGHGNILESGEIRWFKWYNPLGSVMGYHAKYWGSKAGEVFYPSGWQPVISCVIGNDRRTMTMVVPSQDTSPTSENPMHDTVTLLFSKIDDTQN